MSDKLSEDNRKLTEHHPLCNSRAVNGDVYYPESCDCHVATITRLRAELQEAREELRLARKGGTMAIEQRDVAQAQLQAANARADKAETQVKNANNASLQYMAAERQRLRAEQAEVRVRELERALRLVAKDPCCYALLPSAKNAVREALSPTAAPTGEDQK